MIAYLVEFTAVAERQLRAIEEWWGNNRPAARGLFLREVVDAISHLADAPHSGSPYPAPRPASARRLLLQKTGYHLYFTVDDIRSVVTIRSVWHSAREGLPRLR